MNDSTRETGWLILGVVAVAQIVSSLFLNAVVFQGQIVERLRDLHRATGGLIESTLVANLLPLGLVVGVAILWLGRLRLRDVGWVSSHVVPALFVTLAFWLAAQAVLTVIAASGDQPLALHAAWTGIGPGFVLGGVLAQLFGNALAEETVFRGFFFQQFSVKLGKRMAWVPAVVIAALVSQIGFALLHIPNRLLVKDVIGPALVADQIQLVIFGLLFLAIFVVTKNLFVAVGVHALANDPAPLVDAPSGLVATVWLGLALLLVILWKPATGVVKRVRRE